MEMDESREARTQLQTRIAELEKQRADYTRKKSGG